MATTRKRTAARKAGGSSRKLALKKETLKDLSPKRPTAKGGALIAPNRTLPLSQIGMSIGSGGQSSSLGWSG
jgi:hypothetical protein